MSNKSVYQSFSRTFPFPSQVKFVWEFIQHFLSILWSLASRIYRFSKIVSLLVHGLGHSLALVLVNRNPKYFCENVITEGIGFSNLFKNVFMTLGQYQVSSIPAPFIQNSLTSTTKIRIVAVSGILMNFLSIVAVIWLSLEYLAFYTFVNCLLAVFVLTSVLTMLSLPDMIALIKGKTLGWACGPAFAIRYKLSAEEKNSDALVSDRLREMIEILAKEASTRGGQSAGFAFMVKKLGALSIIFDKVVKGKREDVVKVLCQRLQVLLQKAAKEGFKKSGNFEATMLHLRYATGGATHWHNAQPHWYEHYDSMMFHRMEKGALTSQSGEVFNLIAHNGDMDAVHLDIMVNEQPERQLFSQSEARTIFQTVMPLSTSSGDSDSRSIAEWVDFLLTRGLAYKSIRYAYVTRALDFNEDLVHGKFDLELLHFWAERVDLALLNAKTASPSDYLKQHGQSIDDLNDSVKAEIRNVLKKECSKTLPSERVESFLTAFEDAFYRHDLTWVMRQASRNLVGEFALMVCSTSETRMGVFSLTQAFSIGHNLTKGEIFGSAEPQGVTSSLHHGDSDDDAVQINLEDGQYATVEFEGLSGKDSVLIYDRVKQTDDFSVPAKPSKNASCADIHGQQCDWFPVNNNPKIDRSTRTDSPGEEVNKDIKDIPYVLRRVIDSFKPTGENFQTMNHFSDLLFENLTNPKRDSKKYDLVLYGVDFNQDLITEFTLALASILPDLKVRAENSGNVLKEMKRTKREGIGGYGSNTVFLGVSNSAQTQSTLAAARKATELVGSERSFVLTQSFLNSMSQALNQGYHPDDPVLPNTFINLSHFSADGTCGRRRSEAATIVPVATQAVLTEILVYLLDKALQDRPAICHKDDHHKHFEIRHDLQKSDVKAFREFQNAVYDVEISNRVGFNSAGEQIDSSDTITVEKEAKQRAENHIEFIRSYAVFASYIVIATLFGIPVFSVITSPFQSLAGVGFVASILDAALFLCALWLIHVGIRYIQGRPVFERIGARAELYIDRKYIARMVERYNATLFSNAPAFLTPFFYWADTVQDALHRFGIRAHRGVVTIHRTPDERMGVEEANNAAEENMVFAQIGGIRFNYGQPQSRDKVRDNSHFMNRSSQDFKERPYQSVLSDSLEALRKKYDQKLSPETLRLINRRLIDLSDGIVFEFVVGARRRDIVNQSLWDLIKWIPGADSIYQMILNVGIDLKNIIGDADTANQAQIQSTKHPVSPMDINIDTISPRPTIDALISQEKMAEDQSFAVLVFFENCLSVSLNEHSFLHQGVNAAAEILLYPGTGFNTGKLVSIGNDDQKEKFVAEIKRLQGQDQLLISNENSLFQMTIPIATLNSDQHYHLIYRLCMESVSHYSAAA